MNNAEKKITSLFKTLVELLVCQGVQPSDFADNVFDDNYKSVNCYKENGCFIAELNFESNVGGEVEDSQLRYIYDKNRYLMKVEELCPVKGDYFCTWCRKESIVKIAEEVEPLISKMGVSYE